MKILLTLFLFLFFASASFAELRIDITSGEFQPLPIAYLPFEIDPEIDPASKTDAQIEQITKNIQTIIYNNLNRSGLFIAVPRNDFIQTQIPFDAHPDFSAWRINNTQALLVGKVGYIGNRFLAVSFRLWDVFAQKQLTGFTYRVSLDGWRRAAHKVSDNIYHRVTGEKGYFDTRIIYIAESGPFDKRIKKLAIMDQDGANPQIISEGTDLLLTPRFSPIRQEIMYMRIYNRKARVYWLDLINGRQVSLGDFKGMYFAPRFMPSGNSALLSYAEGGNSDIWHLNLTSLKRKRLTYHHAIDTSPSPSPDGKFIAFTSDRSGSPQIYVMNKNGKKTRRLTRERGIFSTPVWSPRGDLIAFTRQLAGRFSIGVIKPDGSKQQILFSDYHVESPTWAPNGRVIMFYKRERRNQDGTGGKTRIYAIDLTGYHLREIPTTTDASDPSWSPLLD